MLLGNLPPKFRSQLYCIQLVALCMSHTIKNNGYKKILEPSIIDLKTLKTEGIYVSKLVCEVKTNVIKVCVSEGFFDLEYLNDRIIKLKFSEVEKSNKPSKVTNILRK